MNKTVTVIGIIVIVIGLYIGIRFVGSVVHYGCAVPGEDCPPPFYGVGQLMWFGTGGELVPFWRR
jgi:hypothetical protein